MQLLRKILSSKSNQSDCQTLTSASIPTRIIGTATFGSLQSVIVRRPEKWIFISRLATSTTLEEIYSFLETTFNMRKDDIFATKVVAKNRDPALLSLLFLLKLVALWRNSRKFYAVRSVFA